MVNKALNKPVSTGIIQNFPQQRIRLACLYTEESYSVNLHGVWAWLTTSCYAQSIWIAFHLPGRAQQWERERNFWVTDESIGLKAKLVLDLWHAILSAINVVYSSSTGMYLRFKFARRLTLRLPFHPNRHASFGMYRRVARWSLPK